MKAGGFLGGLVDTSYVYRPNDKQRKQLERMYSFLKRCNVDASFSSVVDYCINTTYEGDYGWDAQMFLESFNKYLADGGPQRRGQERRK